MKLFHRIAASAVVAGLAFAPATASAQQFINVLTGGTSGVYYPLGVALAKVYADNIEGVKTQVQSTKASVENVNLVTQGRGEIAFALGDTVKAAAEGNADAGFQQPVENLRAIAAIYPNYVQIVASQESGITDLAGLKGKALSVGAPASGTELNARAIFGAAEMSYDDLGKTEYLPFAESVELIKNRQLDATLQSAGLGVASIRDLASSLPITVVAVPAEIAEKLGAPFAAAEIPAGTYDGQDDAVPTLAITNILVTSAEVDEELAYQMTKQLFENLPELIAAHNAAEGIDPKTAGKNLPVPLHPGAERYYKEAGLL
ncbi:TAXI family TRAP transporter solute-binding subunit [Aurantimonas sp. DM33-3]|uniref:TAXI family TRAP transporter solute-binding subunit n=1 Tax=Aurantimonas TaxID=182269 RepID=UPI001652B4F2|nr:MULTISPECIES: TAXI family TRAP transporter solute-binding subunit [Aurantimonas]MBC6715506.1 TAXI family TRAP transporter solute-binding subunit [Aurantimonas sp. DM33-3]MCC4296919.1 TAXI family TRAP transporter solute-binding subunit [Aurantimonas coralicida]